MTGFESLSDLLADVDREADRQSRFPVRFILVSGTDAWSELVTALRQRVEACIELSECCSADDALPYLPEAFGKLDGLGDVRALLLPLGEQLRLWPDAATALPLLAERQRLGRQRIYVPLLDAEDVLSASVARMDRYLAGDLHQGWHLAGRGDVAVAMAEAAPDWQGVDTVRGLRAYFRRWEQGTVHDCLVVTELAPFVTDRAGAVSLTAYHSAWQLARACVAGLDEVPEGRGSGERWRWLVSQSRPGDSLAALAARILEVPNCDGERLFAHWHARGDDERWLAWLWAKTEARRDTYVGLVAEESRGEGQFAELAATAALGRQLDVEHLQQRRRLLEALRMQEPPAAFWRSFAAVEGPYARLQALAGLSQREQGEIVRAVADLITAGEDLAHCLPLLEISYPELAYYLTSFPYGDTEVEDYFRLYTRSRVCDRPLAGLLDKAADLASRRRIWDFPTRGSCLEQERADEHRVLWFDAVGLEWAGLLSELLRSRGWAVQVRVCHANLPSTTPYNSDWGNERPSRQMDQEAHNYDYSYPASLVREIGLVGSFADTVSAALEESPVVLVTADHGLTRFAGAGVRASAPDGAVVHHRGRYADLSPGAAPDQADALYYVYEHRAILAAHGLFAGGTDAIGEVHGGATPEECLVPVIVVQRAAMPVVAVTIRVVETDVRLNTRGEGVLTIEASAPLARPELVLGGARVAGQADERGRWRFALRGLAAGEQRAYLESGGRVVAAVTWRTQRGLVQDDLGL